MMHKHAFQPSVEGMERKLALSGVTATFVDGHLQVEGTKGDDTILLSVDDFGQVRVFDGAGGQRQLVEIGGATSIPLASVGSIRVEGGKGDDTILMGVAEFATPAEIGGKEIVLDGGQGDDTLAAYPWLSSREGEVGTLRLLGGQGEDSLAYIGNTYGAVDLVLEGGKDDDRIELVRYFEGDPRTRIEGGPGDDAISASLIPAPGTPGDGDLAIEGGPGENDITVL